MLNQIVVEGIHYLFILLQLKIFDSINKNFKTFKKPEILLMFWDELKNVDHYIDEGCIVIANGFAKLDIRLLQRLHSYILSQQSSPPDLELPIEVEKWIL